VRRRILFYILVGLLGLSLGAVVVFQVAFVAAVIPHAGIF
jgi:hypothetical protein